MDERMLRGFENSSPFELRREKFPANDLRSLQCYRGGRSAATRVRSRYELEPLVRRRSRVRLSKNPADFFLTRRTYSLS